MSTRFTRSLRNKTDDRSFPREKLTAVTSKILRLPSPAGLVPIYLRECQLKSRTCSLTNQARSWADQRQGLALAATIVLWEDPAYASSGGVSWAIQES
jgi:hypothetical protein